MSQTVKLCEINVYRKHADQLDESPHIQIMTTETEERRCNLCFKWNVKELRIYGGFATSDASFCAHKFDCCNKLLSRLLIVVICLYNFANVCWAIGFVVSSLIKQTTNKATDEKWCASLDINIGLLQIQSALLYICGLGALRCLRYVNIDYKPISRCLWVSFIIPITFLPWVTGFTTLFDHENWEFGGDISSHYAEISLYCLDILRYWPPVAIVVLLYGHLSVFGDKMKQFVKERSQSIRREVSIGNGSTDHPPADFDHKGYKIAFKKMVKPSKDVLRKFSKFIVVFFIFNFITMCIIFWTLVRHFFGTGCHLSFWYHFHYSSEIGYFLLLWALLIYALNANYRLIVEHRYAIMYMGDLENGKGQQRTLWYLKSIIQRHSPFSIKLCGVKIPPSNQMLLVIVCTVVVPTIVHVIEFARRFYS